MFYEEIQHKTFWQRFCRVLPSCDRFEAEGKCVICEASISPEELESVRAQWNRCFPGKILYLVAGGEQITIYPRKDEG